MKGYVEGSNATFISAIGDLQSLLDAQHDKTFFWGDEQPLSGDMMNLAGVLKGSNKFTGKTTNIPEILGKMATEASSHLSFFVTDGIPSPENTVGLENSMGTVKNAIANSLKGKENIAVAIFRKTSGYTGVYYDYKNSPHKLKNVMERPFFVIAVGTRDEIQWLMNQIATPTSTVCKSFRTDTEQITFGLHKHNPELAFSNAQDFSVGKDGKLKLKKTSGEIKLYANMPKCLTQDLGEKYITTNWTKVFNDKPAANFNLNLVNNQITLSCLEIRDLVLNKENTITIQLDKTKQLEEWYRYSSSDDTNIEKGSAPQTETFFLQALLDGIYEAIEGGTPYLINTKITFIK